MDDPLENDLYRRTLRLLEPGEIDLVGAIVHTEFDLGSDLEMHDATIEVGEVIAAAAGIEPGDTYVYSGVDDPEFSSNQHQGRTLDGEEFVWECQQLLRDGTFDLVFYYEASADQERVVEGVEGIGFEITTVP
ncbi:DUF5778 family protein [Natronorarus salvus]|uniref:DUF5778 family protein n=1 Tax=Natronorarus salvus TaxID=3117733 RepID=UPI002F26CB14